MKTRHLLQRRTEPGDFAPIPGSRSTTFQASCWPWGPVIAEDVIDGIGILTYLVDLSNTHGASPSEHGNQRFAAFVQDGYGDWKRVGSSHYQMDSAIVHAIAWRRCGGMDGARWWAAAFERMTHGGSDA